jgi:hypothetical protein
MTTDSVTSFGSHIKIWPLLHDNDNYSYYTGKGFYERGKNEQLIALTSNLYIHNMFTMLQKYMHTYKLKS